MTPLERIARRLGGHPDEATLVDYADGAAANDARIEAHLAKCERCRASVAAMRELRRALRSLAEVEPPRSFRLNAAMVGQAPRQPGRRPYPLAQLAGALAVAVFAGLVAYDVTTSGEPAREAGGARETASEAARTFAEGTPEAPAAALGQEPAASPPATDAAAPAPAEEAPAPAEARHRDGGARVPLRVAEGVAGAVALGLLVWLVLSRRKRPAVRGP